MRYTLASNMALDSRWFTASLFEALETAIIIAIAVTVLLLMEFVSMVFIDV